MYSAYCFIIKKRRSAYSDELSHPTVLIELFAFNNKTLYDSSNNKLLLDEQENKLYNKRHKASNSLRNLYSTVLLRGMSIHCLLLAILFYIIKLALTSICYAFLMFKVSISHKYLFLAVTQKKVNEVTPSIRLFGRLSNLY